MYLTRPFSDVMLSYVTKIASLMLKDLAETLSIRTSRLKQVCTLYFSKLHISSLEDKLQVLIVVIVSAIYTC